MTYPNADGSQPQPWIPQQPPGPPYTPPPAQPYALPPGQPYGAAPNQPYGSAPMIPLSARFDFDGGAATYFGTFILAFLINLFTLGIGAPWAICLFYSWRTKHTLIDGYRLKFTGSGTRLFGNWIKWWFFTLITLGIYAFWVVPRLTRWITRNQEFDLSMPRVLS